MRKVVSLTIIVLFVISIVGCETAPPSPYRRDAGKPSPTSRTGVSPGYTDAHNHLFGGRGRQNDYLGAASTAIAKMDELGIEKIIVMPPPFTSAQTHSYDIEELLPVVKEYPDRIAALGGGGSLNIMIYQVRDGKVGPKLRQQFEARALEILNKGGVGFGEFAVEHFSLNHDHPYESVRADHPLLLHLADIAARKGVPMDIHMEAVPRDMPLPNRRVLMRSGRNPKMLRENISAFERLLSHNRDARIIWAHAGWCNTGYRTPELCRHLLSRHLNLYMSFKLSTESVPETSPLNWDRSSIRPEWLRLIRDFPDRFIIGTDQFYSAPGQRQIGPQKTAATRRLMSLLPPDLARKIGFENPKRLFIGKAVR